MTPVFGRGLGRILLSKKVTRQRYTIVKSGTIRALLGDACFVFGRGLGRVLLSEKVTR